MDCMQKLEEAGMVVVERQKMEDLMQAAEDVWIAWVEGAEYETVACRLHELANALEMNFTLIPSLLQK